MRKKKLFIDADAILSKRPSGIGFTTIAIIRALSENKLFCATHDIVLITPFNRIANVRLWGFNKNVSVRRSVMTGKVVSIATRLKLMPPADLVYGKGIYLFTNFRNWPLTSSKSLTYIHDVSFREFPEYIESKNLRYLQAHVDRWINRTDIVVTVSKHAKKEITSYYPSAADKIKVVYNGISPDFVPIPDSDAEQTLNRYNLQYKGYFMFLSNIEPRKNIEGLLDAYSRFIRQKSMGDVKLILVGGMGWKNEDILEKVALINNDTEHIIVPAHYVPDEELPALLSGAAALVHPAHYEGFGISPLQAMACGTQVVVANNTSLPEVIGDGGEYVDDKSPADILRGMKLAYNNRYDSNKKGIKRAQRFTWDASAQELIDLIIGLEGSDDKED